MKARVSTLRWSALLSVLVLLVYFQFSPLLLSAKPTVLDSGGNVKEESVATNRRHLLHQGHQSNARRRVPNPNPIEPLRLFLSEKNGGLAACQIPNVCMEFMNNRQIIHVPDVYRSTKRDVAKCLISTGWPLLKFYNKSSPLSKNTYDFDIAGVPFNNKYYHHFAHLIPEFMRHNMVPFSFFSSSSNYRFAQCISPSNGKRQKCRRERNIDAKLVFSSGALGSKLHWNHEFVNMLLGKKNRRGLYMLPEAVPNSPVCFRSVLTSPNRFNSANKVHDGLLRDGGVQRKLEMKGKCSAHIVMIVRDSSKSLDRTVPAEIMRALLREMPSIEVVQDLGKLSLKGQISIMQRANIIICAHGAEISNLVFVRERTRIIELFPFGYYYRYFDTIYELFNVRNVRRLVSRPDIDRFIECMNKRAEKNMPKIFFNQEIKEKSLKEYRRFVQAKNGTYKSKDYAARYCARTQRILIDPKYLARIAREETRQFCNYRNENVKK